MSPGLLQGREYNKRLPMTGVGRIVVGATQRGPPSPLPESGCHRCSPFLTWDICDRCLFSHVDALGWLGHLRHGLFSYIDALR